MACLSEEGEPLVWEGHDFVVVLNAYPALSS
jgi:hypothetical protein